MCTATVCDDVQKRSQNNNTFFIILLFIYARSMTGVSGALTAMNSPQSSMTAGQWSCLTGVRLSAVIALQTQRSEIGDKSSSSNTVNQPNVQLREKRPLLLELSVWKITKRDELDDVIVDMATVQNLPSDDELALEPSYSDTLSYLHTGWCSKCSSSNVTDTTCNIHRLTQLLLFHCVDITWHSHPLIRLGVFVCKYQHTFMLHWTKCRLHGAFDVWCIDLWCC